MSLRTVKCFKMTYPQKTTQKHKMITLTVLYLLVAAVIAQNNEDDSNVEPFAEYDLSLTKDHPVMRLDMTYADHSIIATKEAWNQLRPTGFWVKLISPESNSTISECFHPFRTAAQHSIIRLSEKTILFESMPISIDSKIERKLILLNLKNCNYTSVYDGPLSHGYKIFTSNNASDENFTLVMNGKQFCRGHNWCRLFFNPVYQKFESLNFDFPLTGLFKYAPVTSFDANLFVVQLLDKPTNTYKVRLYNVTANYSTPSDYKELLSLPNFVSFRLGWSKIELISSALSYCWRTTQDIDEDKTVHCVAFRADGTVVVNQTMTLSNVFKFYKVQNIPNGLILIGKRECANEIRCAEVQATMITNDSCVNSTLELITVRNRYYNLKCKPSFVSQMYLRVNVSIDSAEVDHICIYMDRTNDGSSRTYVFNVDEWMEIRTL